MGSAPTPYDAGFYALQDDWSAQSARVVVPLVMDLVRPASVLDVGCGTGTWLAAFAAAGVADYLGMDGEYVARDRLKIPADRFRPADLATTPAPGRRFDLASCLEVAEHLPAATAPALVGMLTAAAPAVLFSAALPGQGGIGHVNEQWPWYWQELFAARGYVRLDPLRKAVWQHPEVAPYYQQNLFLYLDPKTHGPLADRLRPAGQTAELTLVLTSVLRGLTTPSYFRRGVRKLLRIVGRRG